MGDRGDVDDARAFSDLLRCPKSLSQCLIVRCRPSESVVPVFVLKADTMALPITISAPMPAMIQVMATMNATYRLNARSPK